MTERRRKKRHIAAMAAAVIATAFAGVLEWMPSDSPAKGDRLVRSAPASAEPTVSPESSASPNPESASGSPMDPPPASSTPEPVSGIGSSPPMETTVAPYVIAAAGDIACDPTNEFFRRGQGTANWCRQQDTANLVRQMNPDMVVPLGDIQYDEGKLSQYRKSYDRSWGRLKDITYPVIGNHEYYDGKPTGYFSYFGRRAGEPNKGWYTLERAGWQLITLNSNCTYEVECGPGSPQYEWLQRELASSAATCEVAFLHHPLFSSGPHGNERSVRPLWQLLYDAGVELIVGAHDHIYERFAKQTPTGERDPDTGIRQITSGAGGAENYWIEKRVTNSVVRNAKTFGVVELALLPTSYEWNFRSVGRRLFSDVGSDVCH